MAAKKSKFRISPKLLHFKFNEHFKGYHIQEKSLGQNSQYRYCVFGLPFSEMLGMTIKNKVAMDYFVREKTKYANLL